MDVARSLSQLQPSSENIVLNTSRLSFVQHITLNLLFITAFFLLMIESTVVKAGLICSLPMYEIKLPQQVSYDILAGLFLRSQSIVLSPFCLVDSKLLHCLPNK